MRGLWNSRAILAPLLFVATLLGSYWVADAGSSGGAAGGGIGGSTGAADNAPLCADGAGGATLGACTVAAFPSGTAAAPSISFAIDPTTGIYGDSGYLHFSVGGTRRMYIAGGATPELVVATARMSGGLTRSSGFTSYVEANTAGSGAPNVLSPTETEKVLTNEGATAEQYNTLPDVASGYIFEACVQDSDGLRLTASTGDTIRSAASVTSAGGYIASTTIGSCVTIKGINATEWMATAISGTWSFN